MCTTRVVEFTGSSELQVLAQHSEDTKNELQMLREVKHELLVERDLWMTRAQQMSQIIEEMSHQDRESVYLSPLPTFYVSFGVFNLLCASRIRLGTMVLCLSQVLSVCHSCPPFYGYTLT